MTARKSKSAPHKVGYGKPPRHTRFRKGQSGNPCGRPPRDPAQRLKALTLQEAYRATVIDEGGRMVPATAMRAILRCQTELAINGNVQAQRAILAAVRRFEKENELAAMLAEGGASAGESGTETCEYDPDAEEGDTEVGHTQDLDAAPAAAGDPGWERDESPAAPPSSSAPPSWPPDPPPTRPDHYARHPARNWR
jgi:hypothetical protein